MEFVTTAAGIEEAFANGKVASLIGMAIWAVTFPRQGYKINYIFGQNVRLKLLFWFRSDTETEIGRYFQPIP